MTALTFRDLLVASLIVTAIEENGQSLRQTELFDPHKKLDNGQKAGAFNARLAEEKIPPLITAPLTGTGQLQRSIERLRETGIIASRDPQNRRAAYTVTDKGTSLVHVLRAMGWRQWPLSLAFNGDEPDFYSSLYMPEDIYAG
jgi:hypothetical protein